MFKKATRRKAKLKLALSGPSGAGKTGSALLIAAGIGGKIAVIDTENDSASLYVGQEISGQKIPEFDTLNLRPPYTTKAYITAMEAAYKAGYDVLIIDSGSHQWSGEGSVLSRKEQLDQKPGSNTWTNWGKFTPETDSFKNAILQCPIHLIMTLRAKNAYEVTKDTNGKNRIDKLGLQPIQRDGLEYEFTAFLDVDMTHHAECGNGKDRTGLFDGKRVRITTEVGTALRDWLNAGEENSATGVSLDTLQDDGGLGDGPPKNQSQAPRPRQPEAPPAKPKVDVKRPLQNDELENLRKIAKDHLWSSEEFTIYLRRKYKTMLACKMTLEDGMALHKVIVSMTGSDALSSLPAEPMAANPIKPSPTPNQAPPINPQASGAVPATFPDPEGGDPIPPLDDSPPPTEQGSFDSFNFDPQESA